MIEKTFSVLGAYAILATFVLVFTEGFTPMLLKIGIYLLLMTTVMSLWKSCRNWVTVIRNYSFFLTFAIFMTYSLVTAFLYMLLRAMVGALLISKTYDYLKKNN